MHPASRIMTPLSSTACLRASRWPLTGSAGASDTPCAEPGGTGSSSCCLRPLSCHPRRAQSQQPCLTPGCHPKEYIPHRGHEEATPLLVEGVNCAQHSTALLETAGDVEQPGPGGAGKLMCWREGEDRVEREEERWGREREGRLQKGLSLILQFYGEQTRSSQ